MATVLLGELNRSFNPSSLEPSGAESQPSGPPSSRFFHSKPSFTLMCGILGLLFLLFNLKNLPGMWHMRVLNAFRFTIRTLRPAVAPSSSHIFQPLVTSSSAQLLELDFNAHKSNSSYFADIDISRAHLACTLFASGIEEMRGGTAAYTGAGGPQFGLALAAVSCNFRKEVAPFQEYEMWSKVLSWDEKWLYVVTHFVRKGAAQPRSYSLYPRSDKFTRSEDGSSVDDTLPATGCDFVPENALFATALSKCVFKSGRKTVSPDTMLRLSGLFPSSDSEGGEDSHQLEQQRLEGLRIASTLVTENQKALEAEFTGGNGGVLGRHTDGSGIVGVVGTLLQLAGLRRTQVL